MNELPIEVRFTLYELIAIEDKLFNLTKVFDTSKLSFVDSFLLDGLRKIENAIVNEIENAIVNEIENVLVE